jgi:hypothetical protein
VDMGYKTLFLFYVAIAWKKKKDISFLYLFLSLLVRMRRTRACVAVPARTGNDGGRTHRKSATCFLSLHIFRIIWKRERDMLKIGRQLDV